VKTKAELLADLHERALDVIERAVNELDHCVEDEEREDPDEECGCGWCEGQRWLYDWTAMEAAK
jgi:hypothetical protein